MTESLDYALLAERFSRLLRDNGLKLAGQRAALFASALGLVEPVLVSELYLCAKVSLVSDPDEFSIFDKVFKQIFGDVGSNVPSLVAVDSVAFSAVDEDLHSEEVPDAISNVDRDSLSTSRVAFTSYDARDEGHNAADDLSAQLPLVANDLESLRRRNFSEILPSEREAIETLLRSLAYKLPRRRSARLSASYFRGDRIDLRDSIRRAHRTGGDVVHLSHRRFKQKDRRVIVLVDISGSMDPYRDFYLSFFSQFLSQYPLEVFTLATRLSRVTRFLKVSALSRAEERLSSIDLDWSSGTTIGKTIAEFLDNYGRKGMCRRAVIVIVSDGWESGDVSLLGEQMRRMALLAHKIVWVNPRQANPQYQPLTAGMRAVLPFCDQFMSGHSVESLAEIIEAISR